MSTKCPLFLPTYTVIQIKEGYHTVNEEGVVRSASGITLVKGPHNVLVGTGLPQDKDMILSALERQLLKTNDLHYVICSDGRVENIGNLNLFPDAVHIIGQDIKHKDITIKHHFVEDVPYEIDEDLEVVWSPGVSQTGVSVMVAKSNFGIVAIAGGTFHSAADLEDPDVWIEHSGDPDAQQKSRINILRDATYIVPRYGAMFEVPSCYKGEIQIVMTPVP